MRPISSNEGISSGSEYGTPMGGTDSWGVVAEKNVADILQELFLDGTIAGYRKTPSGSYDDTHGRDFWVDLEIVEQDSHYLYSVPVQVKSSLHGKKNHESYENQNVLCVVGQGTKVKKHLCEIFDVYKSFLGSYYELSVMKKDHQRLQETVKEQQSEIEKLQGKLVGRLKVAAPYGYTIDKDELIPIIEEQKIMSRLIDLYEEGLDSSAIATVLTKEGYKNRGISWNKQSVQNLLNLLQEQFPTYFSKNWISENGEFIVSEVQEFNRKERKDYIMSLSKKGLPFSEIARILNEKGMQRPRGGKYSYRDVQAVVVNAKKQGYR